MKLSANGTPDIIFWMFSKTGQPNRSKISSHCPELKSKCSLSNGDQPGRTCSRSATPSIVTSPASVKRPTKSPWNWWTSRSDSHSWLNEFQAQLKNGQLPTKFNHWDGKNLLLAPMWAKTKHSAATLVIHNVFHTQTDALLTIQKPFYSTTPISGVNS
jgi:hypothetical protein